MKRVNIYVYSTIKSPRRQQGYVGYVVEAPDIKATGNARNTVEGFGAVEGTYHHAHLVGLCSALNRIREPCEIELYMSDGYIGRVILNGYLDAWSQQTWKTANNTEVKDRELWEFVKNQIAENRIFACVNSDSEHKFYEWLKRETEKRLKAYKETHNDSTLPV